MNTRILMTAAALVLALLGLGALFAPQELLTYLGAAPSGFLPPLVQLLAAALLGMAMIDWMAKGSKVGGIYNRPIAIGNLTHFAIGAISLAKFTIHGHPPVFAIVVSVVYVVFALAFGVVVFGRGTS
jgi:hypothetical protein